MFQELVKFEFVRVYMMLGFPPTNYLKMKMTEN